MPFCDLKASCPVSSLGADMGGRGGARWRLCFASAFGRGTAGFLRPFLAPNHLTVPQCEAPVQDLGPCISTSSFRAKKFTCLTRNVLYEDKKSDRQVEGSICGSLQLFHRLKLSLTLFNYIHYSPLDEGCSNSHQLLLTLSSSSKQNADPFTSLQFTLFDCSSFRLPPAHLGSLQLR